MLFRLESSLWDQDLWVKWPVAQFADMQVTSVKQSEIFSHTVASYGVETRHR